MTKTSPDIGPNGLGQAWSDVAVQASGGIGVPVYHIESMATCRNINELVKAHKII